MAHLARRKDLKSLLEKVPENNQEKNDSRIFFTTPVHPHDNYVKHLEILVTSLTTTYIHQKKLIVGYRRPKNLRDVFVRAAIPFIAGDEKHNPNHIPPMMTEPAATSQRHKAPGDKQLKMDHNSPKKEDHKERLYLKPPYHPYPNPTPWNFHQGMGVQLRQQIPLQILQTPEYNRKNGMQCYRHGVPFYA